MTRSDYCKGLVAYALASIPIAMVLDPPIFLQVAVQFGCMMHLHWSVK